MTHAMGMPAAGSGPRTFEALDASLQRIESLMGESEPAPFHRVQSAVSDAAAALGLEAGNLPRPMPGEPTEAAIRRLAGGAGLITRAITLDDGYLAGGTGPLIACLRSTGDAVALTRRGQHWRLHDHNPATGHRKLTPEDRADIEERAFQISPALPDTPISMRMLAGFNWRSILPDLVGYAIMGVIAGLIIALMPILTSTIIGTVVPGRELRLLADIAMMMLVLLACHSGVDLASRLAMVRIEGKLGSSLRTAALDRVVRLAPEKRAGVAPPIMALSVRAVEGWHRAVWKLGLGLVASVLMVIPSLCIVASTMPLAAVTVFVVALVFAGSAAAITMLQQKTLTRSQANVGSWMTTAYESFRYIETVRATGAEAALFGRWSEGFVAQQRRQLASSRQGAIALALEAALEPALVLAAIGGIVLATSTLSMEASIPFVMATVAVAGAISAMMGAIGQAGMLALQWKLAHSLLSAVPEKPGAGAHLTAFEGQIQVVSVSYRYRPDHMPALVNVSLEVPAGAFVAITGPSGSGKTTLLQLVLGLKQPETGAVFLDDVDIRSLDMAAMRRRIGIVGQGATLFPGTLRENVALGLPLSDKAIWEALGLAGMEVDVSNMPLGLSTIIGDTDQLLSGGQVQRLLFARAIAARPRLVVLDEATSALDPAAQATITRSLKQLGVSILAVAHRLETLRECDSICVLDGGEIVQHGSFEELSSAGGPFRSLLCAGQFAKTAQ